MLINVISNGGLIYMVYPCMVFLALMQESRPGKTYWYFVILYTQVVIIVQFMAQLNFMHFPFDQKIYSFS